MTIERNYSCNLCHDSHNLKDGKLYGIWWTGGHNSGSWAIKPAREVEHHLCWKCIGSIKKFDVSEAAP